MRNRLKSIEQPAHALARTVVGLAMKVHRTLGCGFAEAVYRNSLAFELRKAGIGFECHPAISVMYEGTEVGIYQADLIIEKKLIVELKVASGISDEHLVQLVNYLSATKIEDGLLLNFGTAKLEFRTKTRTYQPKNCAPDLHS
jgi:GxxExxY protein